MRTPILHIAIQYLRRYTLILLGVGLSVSVHSQSLTSETNIYIPQDLNLYLDGDFGNAGFIQNQGNFYISGNWRNTNVYQGTGRVILNGDRLQNFSNNDNDVYHLVVDGNGTKNIINKLTITNRLDLFFGVVNVTDDDTLLLSQNVIIGGGSQESHVNGALTYAGTGYKFFPIGKNGKYHPVEMLDITGIGPVTELEVFEDLPSIDAPSNVKVYPRIFWERKSIRGNFTGSPLAIGYQIPDNHTNRYVIDVLQGDAPNLAFTTLGNTTVEYGDAIDKVITDNVLTGKIFVLGESIPVDGIPGEFYLPTSLSPHASISDNRFIRIFGNQLTGESFHFVVYNRWGLVVYENRSLEFMITKGWDGRHKGDGDFLPAGAYPYVLKAVTKTGETMEKKGVLSIIN